jgi:hypothetical protein
MRGKLLFLVSVFAGSLIGPVAAAWTEGEPTLHLYSWKEGEEWFFSLVPDGSVHRADVEIKREKPPLRGPSKLKEHLYQMPEGNVVSWQQRAESGMKYPPKEIVDDLRDFAQSVGVKLRMNGK